MSKFQEFVAAELVRARMKHLTPQNSYHEGYGVVLEELDEVWDLVKSQHPDKTSLLKELIQVAAMAQRFAEDQLLSDEEVVEQAAEVEDEKASTAAIKAQADGEADTFGIIEMPETTFCECADCRRRRL